MEPDKSRITAHEAQDLGVCTGDVEPGSQETDWQLIDEELEGQSAVTIWRPVRRRLLENARNGTATVVELKPKTGRYHQLRRHMVGLYRSARRRSLFSFSHGVPFVLVRAASRRG